MLPSGTSPQDRSSHTLSAKPVAKVPISATTPATWGAAMEVPEEYPYPPPGRLE